MLEYTPSKEIVLVTEDENFNSAGQVHTFTKKNRYWQAVEEALNDIIVDVQSGTDE